MFFLKVHNTGIWCHLTRLQFLHMSNFVQMQFQMLLGDPVETWLGNAQQIFPCSRFGLAWLPVGCPLQTIPHMFKLRLLAILPRLPELPFLWSSKLYFFFSFSTGLKACRALGSPNPYFSLNLRVIEGYFLPANLCSKTNCWVRKITITFAVQQLCVSLTWHDGMTQ